MVPKDENAPGWPGKVGKWKTGAKDAVGGLILQSNRIWFTIGHGICDEIYYPRHDSISIRDCGLIVTDGKEFFSEEQYDTIHAVSWIEAGLPEIIITNTCKRGHYRITKKIYVDPFRDTLVQRIQFDALKGTADLYHVSLLAGYN